MTPVSPSETIAKAMEGVTPGPWTVDDEHDDYGIAIFGRPTWKCTRYGVEGEWDVAHIEVINDRDAETKANAAYIAACSPDRMREVLDELYALRKVVKAVMTWADQRCPCHNDQPNPCPLCGASVENLEPRKSAENTIPRHLLAELRRASDRGIIKETSDE
jgi:hypothetical protein